MAEVQLNNTPFTLRIRRGLRANVYKPDVHYNHAAVPEGELLYTTDTEQIYYTNATRVRPVLTVDMLITYAGDFVFNDDEPMVND